MKIVSLQSVELGAVFAGGDGSGIPKPFVVKVGSELFNGISDIVYTDDKEVTVEKIEFGDMYHGIEMPKQDNTYFVYTSDGHIRVLPADKYIAEWSE